MCMSQEVTQLPVSVPIPVPSSNLNLLFSCLFAVRCLKREGVGSNKHHIQSACPSVMTLFHKSLYTWHCPLHCASASLSATPLELAASYPSSVQPGVLTSAITTYPRSDQTRRKVVHSPLPTYTRRPAARHHSIESTTYTRDTGIIRVLNYPPDPRSGFDLLPAPG